MRTDDAGRPYGETGLDESFQLEADRKWWPVAAANQETITALVFVVDGKVRRIRKVTGVDREETVAGGRTSFLVSGPLSDAEVADELPGLPVKLGDERPAKRGRLRTYLRY